MDIQHLKISGLRLFSPSVFHDPRGFFFESFQEERFARELGSIRFVQDNVSLSKKGTVRALHFQSDPGQAKLVTCLSGQIWDVAVDLRPDSLTFGQWEAMVLDGMRAQQLFIPVGFAHGFCVLSDEALVQYKVSSYYNPQTECSIRWNDPDLAIAWPVQNPILSERDQNCPMFRTIDFLHNRSSMQRTGGF